MILSLDLKKTYGQTNADIAKKNKINKISISVKSLTESSDTSGVSLPTQSLTSVDNINTKTVATDYKTLVWKSMLQNPKTSNFSSRIGNVLYKEYQITIDLSKEEYSSLKLIKTPPQINVLFSGIRYKLSSEKTYTLLTKSGTTEKQVDIDYSEILYALTNDVDLVSGLDNLTTNGFWGETAWTETSSIVNNNYTIGNDTNNAYSEIVSFIQDGANSAGPTFSSLVGVLAPTIASWVNNGETIIAKISIPSEVYLFGSDTGYLAGKVPDLPDFKMYSYLKYSNADMFKYEFSSATIEIPEYQYDSETKTYYKGNHPYNADSSDLFTDDIHLKDTPYAEVTHPDGTQEKVYDKYYDENFADDIYTRYKNGKLMIDLTYPVSEIKDISGLDVVYSSRYGLLTKIDERFFDQDGNEVLLSTGDAYTTHILIPEGTICSILNNGQQVYTNTDGSQKYFIVQTSNFSYSGILQNNLTLSETTLQETNTFNRLSWSQLDALGNSGSLPNYVTVGDRKYVTTTDPNQPDSVKTMPFVVLGFNHDNLSNGNGKAGMTVGMEGVLYKDYRFNDSAKTLISWSDSEMRTKYLPQLSTYLPSDLQSVIKIVDKISVTNNNSNTIYSNTEDKLFLLSLTEILGSDYISGDSSLKNKYGANEGQRYEYWATVKNGQSAEDRLKYDYKTFETIDGANVLSPQDWQTRSILKSTTLYENALIGSGGDIGENVTTNNRGVSYAFCIGQQITTDYKGSLENASWTDINALSVSGEAQNLFKIGDTKSVTLTDGTQLEFVIAGLYHDNIYDSDQKAGITFAMKDTNENLVGQMNATSTNTGSWGSSKMRNTTMEQIFNKLPEDLKCVIKPVKKLTSAGEKSSEIVTTKDKLWIPSCVELTGDEEEVISGEGTQYEYFKNAEHLVSSDTKWTRSPYYNSNTSWVSVSSQGVIQPSQSALNENGVLLFFCV